MRKLVTLALILCAGVLAFFGMQGCDNSAKNANPVLDQSTSVPVGNTLDAPTITCVGETQHTIFLQVCAGPSGAAAGFSVQWVKKSDFPSLTCGASGQDALWPPSDDATCKLNKASFSGVPGCSIYNLGPGGCVIVEIGNLNDAECGVGLDGCSAGELECGTEYVFRAFAHATTGSVNSSPSNTAKKEVVGNVGDGTIPGSSEITTSGATNGKKRSPFTANHCCSTESCVAGCVLTQGYWKTHPCEWPAPFVPGAPDATDLNLNGVADNLEGQCALTNNPNEQCPCDALNSILVGSNAYTQCDLLCSFGQPAQGNGLRILAHQLIAASLNVLAGASDAGTVTDPLDSGNPYNGYTVAALISLGNSLIGGTNILTGSEGTQCAGQNADPEGCAMVKVSKLLDLYNNGDGGVAHCN